MRKEIKKDARLRLKNTYWMMVVLCLFMAAIGLSYSSSLDALRSQPAEGNSDFPSLVYSKIIEGHDDQAVDMTTDYIKEEKHISWKIGIVSLEHAKGIFANAANSFGSGKMLLKIYYAIKSVTGSKSAAIGFFVIVSLLFIFLVYFMVYKPLEIAIKRAVLEMRQYDKYPVSRMLYLLRIKQYWNVVAAQLLKTVYTLLWMLTVAGAVIKTFSYMMVPYILAENPSIGAKEAITLSRRMMDGHKWEAFKLELSFLGWHILSIVTFGLSGIFFSNPYREMTLAEYYKFVRADAKNKLIKDTDYLDDKYLFEFADEELLSRYYRDSIDALKEAEAEYPQHTGLRRFFENTIGLILFYDDDEKQYQKIKTLRLALKNHKAAIAKEMYPFRLFMQNHTEDEVKLGSVQYQRHYSLLSIIFMFFSVSFIGWCYEVSIHLVKDGIFVNRGVLHGPWLPIYGSGGILILLILYKLREKPIIEFISAIVLCGFVEYFTSWFLQVTHDGMKWWDYHGYFLNINGRVCGEGLLVFGLGGLAIVYLLAPFLDNHFRHIPKKIAIVVAALLIGVYVTDMVYSNSHPNMGAGITDYAVQTAEQIDTVIADLEVS